MSPAPSMLKLFSPLALGGKNPVQLKHRVVMAPLTRCRTGAMGAPTELNVEYYKQRATDGGLLISEATNISEQANGYFGAPGIFRQDQIEAWKAVTGAVHSKGGKMFLQLWHTGRVSHPLNQPGGAIPVSASATSMENVASFAVTVEGRKNHVTPRALETDEIPGIVEDYKKAATNALEAGFDGVELHAANGYLLEQFLCDNTNQRTDKYGGSIENRARFMLEALEGIVSVVDSSKVGLRLSPFGLTFGCEDSTPEETYSHVIKKVNDFNLAYLHLVEPSGKHTANSLTPEEDVSTLFRRIYDGKMIAAGGFDRATAIKAVEDGKDDMIAFGRDFIGSPDLVERLKVDTPLNKYSMQTFYPPPGVELSVGYTDYPFMKDE